jgi:hypothetical protein
MQNGCAVEDGCDIGVWAGQVRRKIRNPFLSGAFWEGKANKSLGAVRSISTFYFGLLAFPRRRIAVKPNLSSDTLGLYILVTPHPPHRFEAR